MIRDDDASHNNHDHNHKNQNTTSRGEEATNSNPTLITTAPTSPGLTQSEKTPKQRKSHSHKKKKEEQSGTASPSAYTKYTVQPNENLLSVAIKFRMTAGQFRQLNKLTTNSMLYPGQVVLVKAGDSKSDEDRSNANTPVPDRTAKKEKGISHSHSEEKQTPFSHKTPATQPVATPTTAMKEERKGEPLSGSPASTLDFLGSFRHLFEFNEIKPSDVPPTIISPKRTVLPTYESSIYKIQIKYVVEELIVGGNLTLTDDIFAFEPDLTEAAVEIFGLVRCQFSCLLSDIVDARTLQLSFAERISLGLGNFNTQTSERYFLQISIGVHNNVVYFILPEDKIIEFEENFKKSLKVPQTYVDGADKLRNPIRRYGPVVAKKLFPEDLFDAKYNEEEHPDVKWDYVPELHGKSYILNEEDVSLLTTFLPPRFKLKDWELLFCTSTDGISMLSFYLKTRDADPTLLIVEDKKGHIFGAFVTEPWEKQKGYYGTGECFLFKLRPKELSDVWRWTGRNTYFMYSNENSISVGGGRGQHGLWLGNDWYDGISQCSDTFENKPLSYSEKFVIKTVEIWKFV